MRCAETSPQAVWTATRPVRHIFVVSGGSPQPIVIAHYDIRAHIRRSGSQRFWPSAGQQASHHWGRWRPGDTSLLAGCDHCWRPMGDRWTAPRAAVTPYKKAGTVIGRSRSQDPLAHTVLPVLHQSHPLPVGLLIVCNPARLLRAALPESLCFRHKYLRLGPVHCGPGPVREARQLSSAA